MPTASPSRLRLVAAAPTCDPPRPRVDLSTTPFRPGELPCITSLALNAATRAAVEQHAAAARLPLEIYVRIATEASRVVGEVAARTGRSVAWVCAALHDAAAHPSAVTAVDAPGMTRYVQAFDVAAGGGKAPPGDLALRLPEDMTGAWRRAAREAGTALAAWVAARVADTPDRCVTWERAAASECRTLGEWAYASALSAIARSSA